MEMLCFSIRTLRLRMFLLVLGFSCSLLAFFSIRCTLFNVSCASDALEDFTPLRNERKNNNVKLHRFFGSEPEAHPLLESEASPPNGSLQHQFKGYMNYSDALNDRADKNGVIILISTDFGYIQMALNLYFTSLKKFNITNFLYVCSHHKAAFVLQTKGIANFLIEEDKDGKTISNYGSAAFNRKTHIKTKIIYDALTLGYTVLIIDADIVLLKNPFPYFTCKDCDLEIQSDGKDRNSGFYLVKPTIAGKMLHAMAIDIAVKQPSLTNQKALAKALALTHVKSKTLDVYSFPYGKLYFEHGQRMFAGDNPCKECVIVHNNWIVSGAAKEYRFKEHLMWQVDYGEYYSKASNKYIKYENPFDFGSKDTIRLELETLKSALSIAFLLKRILILPDFHCYGCKSDACQAKRCSLNAHMRIQTFDKAFGTHYREHMFLKNPLVPASIRSSLSPPILIKSSVTLAKLTQAQRSNIKHQFKPTDLNKGANSTEILKWFQELESYHVLQFHSMYNSFSKFESTHAHEAFTASLGTGFQRCKYRQL